jgi:ketosteroid isomerase-like protein
MTDRKAIVRRWLDVGALGPAEEWHELCSKDLVVRFPYAPPPVQRELKGLDTALATCSAHWGNMARFEWKDVQIHATDDPDLYIATARSETETVGGYPYGNHYVLMTRFKDGKIVEHIEWFDPALVIKMMETLGG